MLGIYIELIILFSFPCGRIICLLFLLSVGFGSRQQKSVPILVAGHSVEYRCYPASPRLSPGRWFRIMVSKPSWEIVWLLMKLTILLLCIVIYSLDRILLESIKSSEVQDLMHMEGETLNLVLDDQLFRNSQNISSVVYNGFDGV